MSSPPPDPHANLRLALSARVLSDVPTADCLDDETVAGLAEGSLDASLRAGALLHLGGCLHCRKAVASVARAIGDEEVARELAKVEAPRRLRWHWLSAAAVASAALILVMVRLVPVTGPRQDGSHRAPTIGNGSVPTPTAPVGLVAAADELRWAAVAGADRYRVTLYDSSGRVIYETEPDGPITSLPDSLRLAPGQRYLWRVDARTGFNRWVSSNLVEFSIASSPPL